MTRRFWCWLIRYSRFGRWLSGYEPGYRVIQDEIDGWQCSARIQRVRRTSPFLWGGILNVDWIRMERDRGDQDAPTVPCLHFDGRCASFIRQPTEGTGYEKATDVFEDFHGCGAELT